MPTVLLTGASGFTGPYVASALKERDYEVIPLGSNGDPGVVGCDLMDTDALRRVVARYCPDYVIHLAALSFVGYADVEAFYRVNVVGTLNLLEALVEAGSAQEKVIVASTANVYGTNARGVVGEDVCPAPVNHYACSKLAMEHMVHTLFDRLPVVITRPFNYTGRGQPTHFLVPKIVDHFRRREPTIELGNVNVSRDFSDVRDVARAYVALMESSAQSETVNICSHSARSLTEIIEALQSISGYTIDVTVNPTFVRSNEIPYLEGRNQKLKELTGYAPSISLTETVRWMYEV